MLYNPVSTYRIQFHKQFSFAQFRKLVPYFEKLGVKTIYASPVFKAVPGSIHGYDILNPQEINPEIGSISELKDSIRQLEKSGIGWLQDIVPNHMAFHTDNEWLNDVLENGQNSKYKDFFDIDWNHEQFDGKLMIPFLNSTVEDAIKQKHLRLVFEKNRFAIKNADQLFPLNKKSYDTVFQLSGTTDPVSCVEEINSKPGQLSKIIDEQHYRFCHWIIANQQINYRRFFIVNGLISLNVQHKEVFEQYHELILSLTREGYFKGLRVDHIDGLCLPAAYLRRLRKTAGDKTFIVVEKILSINEQLPNEWNIEGTTGYEYLTLVNNLFTNRKNFPRLRNLYEQLNGECLDVIAKQLEKKALILNEYMAGEWENLSKLFLSLINLDEISICTDEELKTVIAEFLIRFPVYRLYTEQLPLTGTDASLVEQVFEEIKKDQRTSNTAVELLRHALMMHSTNEDFNNCRNHFFKRCMQYTGPLMAKGVEDTLMYSCNYFVGHNEVGDSPVNFGISREEFHNAMINRQHDSPLALNATSTHDTKRGEDARARLNVLTDLAEEWMAQVTSWRKICQQNKSDNIPDDNEEYFIYQNLIAFYPSVHSDEKNVQERFSAYMEKSLREAKRNSNWMDPNIDYENKVKKFAIDLLNKNSEFGKNFYPFQSKVASLAIPNSLAQLILKFTCPGVPDIYQGCELWDLNFVDPDNRRPVDYDCRIDLLQQIEECEQQVNFLKQIWEDRLDGKIKIWLTKKLLKLRNEHAEYFLNAEYIPVSVTGTYSEHVIAFARRLKKKLIVVSVPLNTASLATSQNCDDILNIDWNDTSLKLPSKTKTKEYLTNKTYEKDSKLLVNSLFESLPFSILTTDI